MNGCEFIRVVTKDNEECFLLTKLKNNGQEGFDLTLCNNGKVWTGSVSEDDLDSLSSRVKMDFNKFVSQTVDALTTLSEGRDAFQYQLNKKLAKDQVEFVWKKHVPDEDITFQLGSTSLKARPDSAMLITQIFNHCIQGMEELDARIQRLETDNQRLSQERINALKRLEKCVVAKEELENDLYTKFTLVLNSKKEKIRQLKAGQFGGDGALSDTGSAPESSVTSTKRARSPEPAAQKDASDSAQDTDDEKPVNKRARGAQKKAVKEEADESLILGDSDEDQQHAAPRARRQRGKATQKKQTPAKPVLPKVGSSDATPGSERKSRLRKSGSSNSNRSSENIDADDLIDQL